MVRAGRVLITPGPSAYVRLHSGMVRPIEGGCQVAAPRMVALTLIMALAVAS